MGFNSGFKGLMQNPCKNLSEHEHK